MTARRGTTVRRRTAEQRRTAERRAGDRDRGETLIELLVAVTILGIGAAAILGGLMLAVDSSTFARSQSGVQALLRSYGDALADAGDTTGTGLYRYKACAVAGDFPAATAVPGVSVPSGWSAAVTAVRYWNGTGFGTGCTTGSDTGVQRVTVSVTAPAGLYPSLTRTLDVVVRRPCAAAGAC